MVPVFYYLGYLVTVLFPVWLSMLAESEASLVVRAAWCFVAVWPLLWQLTVEEGEKGELSNPW